MTPQSIRLVLIQSFTAGGVVPTIRAMRARLKADGVIVSEATIALDYQRLGLQSPAKCGRKRTGRTTTKVELRVPNAAYDHCCRLARQRGVSVAAILRALVAKGLQSKAA